MAVALVEKALQLRNDETFTAGINKYMDILRAFDQDVKEVAMVMKPHKMQKSSFGYVAEIEDLVNPETKLSMFTEDFINHFDDKKVIYNQIYIGDAIYEKINVTNDQVVIFFKVDTDTFKKGRNTYTIHQYKVVNV